ncbi:MAG: SMC-Scp complex subunit ScpB, partial [Lachnospiraceae bacterium]|nr:SMC-Scp complex subunit ScpB [Lachnospiraceae bacterium]
DCSYSITSLTEKGLIKESGRLDVPGKPILYRTTKDFLRVFGLESLNDLPELPEFSDTEDGQITFSEAEHEAEQQSVQNEEQEA